jgi:hypothetical protein
LVFCFIAPSRSINAQARISNKQASEWIARGEDRMWLARPGNPPFHLVANINYKAGSVALDGTYELFWSAPGRFREAMHLGNFDDVEVITDGKIYILRNTATRKHALNRIHMIAQVPRPPAEPASAKMYAVGKVRAGDGGTNATECAELDRFMKGRTICFDAVSGDLTSDEWDISADTGRVEGEFVTIGNSRYPGHQISRTRDDSLEIHVTKLEAVTELDGALFRPPDGAISRDWCPTTTFGKSNMNPFEKLWAAHVIPDDNKPVAIYVVVGTDGRIEKLFEVNDEGTLETDDTAKAGDIRMPVEVCGGRPIEYENNLEWQPLRLR